MYFKHHNAKIFFSFDDECFYYDNIWCAGISILVLQRNTKVPYQINTRVGARQYCMELFLFWNNCNFVNIKKSMKVIYVIQKKYIDLETSVIL